MIFVTSPAFLLIIPDIRAVRSCYASVPCRTEVKVCELFPRMRSITFTVVLHLLKKHIFSFFTSLALGILRNSRQFLLKKMRSSIIPVLMGVGGGLDR